MKKLLLLVVAMISIIACTKEVEVEKIVFKEDTVITNTLKAQIASLEAQLAASNVSNSGLSNQVSELQNELTTAQNDYANGLITIQDLTNTIGSLELDILELENDQSFTEKFAGSHFRKGRSNDFLYTISKGQLIVQTRKGNGCWNRGYDFFKRDYFNKSTETPNSLTFEPSSTDGLIYVFDIYNGNLRVQLKFPHDPASDHLNIRHYTTYEDYVEICPEANGIFENDVDTNISLGDALWIFYRQFTISNIQLDAQLNGFITMNSTADDVEINYETRYKDGAIHEILVVGFYNDANGIARNTFWSIFPDGTDLQVDIETKIQAETERLLNYLPTSK